MDDASRPTARSLAARRLDGVAMVLGLAAVVALAQAATVGFAAGDPGAPRGLRAAMCLADSLIVGLAILALVRFSTAAPPAVRRGLVIALTLALSMLAVVQLSRAHLLMSSTVDQEVITALRDLRRLVPLLWFVVTALLAVLVAPLTGEPGGRAALLTAALIAAATLVAISSVGIGHAAVLAALAWLLRRAAGRLDAPTLPFAQAKPERR